MLEIKQIHTLHSVTYTKVTLGVANYFFAAYGVSDQLVRGCRILDIFRIKVRGSACMQIELCTGICGNSEQCT